MRVHRQNQLMRKKKKHCERLLDRKNMKRLDSLNDSFSNTPFQNLNPEHFGIEIRTFLSLALFEEFN